MRSFTSALVAQERIGAEQSRRARPADRTDQRHRRRLPGLESGENGLEVEEVEVAGAPMDLRLDEAAEGQDAVISPLPLQALDELERGACRSPRGSRPDLPSPRADGIPGRAECTVLAFCDEVEDLVHERVRREPRATSSKRSDSVPSSANRRR